MGSGRKPSDLGGGPPSPPGGVRGRRAGDDSDEFARRFREELLSGDANAAAAIAEGALRSGFDVASIHTRLIEPAMHRIGDLWESDLISVGDEHLATAISHQVAARIYPRVLRARPDSLAKVMLAAVQAEHHVLGLRLVADVLEGAGYEVLYLGADVPLDALLTSCRHHHPAVVGLTVSMWLNVPTLIWEVEQLTLLERPPAMMVGGRAVGPAVEQGLRTPVVPHSDGVLEAVASLLQSPPLTEPMDPELGSRIPTKPELPPGEGEGVGGFSEVFSAVSMAGADAVRESARHAFAMEELAYRDGLTGLFNRHAFDDRLIAMSGPTAVASAILMIDVDRFKSINDEHGHAIGDSTLTAVAGAILQSVRPGDFVARFGGDEFVVLLPDTTEQIALVVAERIRATVESVAGVPATTVSIGAASFASSARLTMRSADRALYEAKELGRNRVRP